MAPMGKTTDNVSKDIPTGDEHHFSSFVPQATPDVTKYVSITKERYTKSFYPIHSFVNWKWSVCQWPTMIRASIREITFNLGGKIDLPDWEIVNAQWKCERGDWIGILDREREIEIKSI